MHVEVNVEVGVEVEVGIKAMVKLSLKWMLESRTRQRSVFRSGADVNVKANNGDIATKFEVEVERGLGERGGSFVSNSRLGLANARLVSSSATAEVSVPVWSLELQRMLPPADRWKPTGTQPVYFGHSLDLPKQ